MTVITTLDKMDFEKTYYLSGPMSGYEDHNYTQFELNAMTLRDDGLKIESPHENVWPVAHENLTEAALWMQMMEKAVTQMDKCHGIILMKGWAQSKGARVELDIALTKGWPVYFYDKHVITSMNKDDSAI